MYDVKDFDKAMTLLDALTVAKGLKAQGVSPLEVNAEFESAKQRIINKKGDVPFLMVRGIKLHIPKENVSTMPFTIKELSRPFIVFDTEQLSVEL